jgi:hypothetical protein
MPNQVTISHGMAFVDRGIRFTADHVHPLDHSLWVVTYDDGHAGVFSQDWLIGLVNTNTILTPASTVSIFDQDEEAALALPTSEEMDLMHEEALSINQAPLMAVVTSTLMDFDRAWNLAHEVEMGEWHQNANEYNRRFNIERARPSASAAQVSCDYGDALVYQMGLDHRAALAIDAARPQRCNGCQQNYTGQLGQEHRCTAVVQATCSNCSTVQRASIGRPNDGNPLICQSCSDQGIIACRKCGRPTALRGNDARSKRVCNNCLPRQQNCIWQSIPKAFGSHIVTEIGSHRPFAVEVESFLDPRHQLDRRESMSTRNWNEGTDGSIHPDDSLVSWANDQGRGREVQCIEFKSPPLMGDDGLLKLHDDTKKIRRMGFRANSSCGLHVHVDAGGFDMSDKKALHKFGKWYEDEMYNLVATSRATNHFCKRLTQQYSETDRYKWLNMSSVGKHGTVEYRLHHGCTIYSRITEWTKLCVKFTEAGIKLGRARQKPGLNLFEAIASARTSRSTGRRWQLSSTPRRSQQREVTTNV